MKTWDVDLNGSLRRQKIKTAIGGIALFVVTTILSAIVLTF